jgi:hypothetical protein
MTITTFSKTKLMSTVEQLPDDTPLSFYNYRLSSQDTITDVTCISRVQKIVINEPTNGTSTSTSGYIPSSSAVEALKYLAAGSGPMLVTYLTLNPDNSPSITGFITSKLTNAVSFAASFTKALWSSSSSSSAQPDSNEEQERASARNINPQFYLHDQNRVITKLLLAPPCPKTGICATAAGVDSLGRVLLIDIMTGEIVRMIKGMRNAQIGWIRSTEPTYPAMLAIYSQRGVLEIYASRYGKRLEASFVGKGLRLVQTSLQELLPMDGSKVTPVSTYIASCFLISPEGDVQIITPSLQNLLNDFEKRSATVDQLMRSWKEDPTEKIEETLRQAILNEPIPAAKNQYLNRLAEATDYNVLKTVTQPGLISDPVEKTLDILNDTILLSGLQRPNKLATMDLLLKQHLTNISNLLTDHTTSHNADYVSSGVKERDEGIEQALFAFGLHGSKNQKTPEKSTLFSADEEAKIMSKSHIHFFNTFEIDSNIASAKTNTPPTRVTLKIRSAADNTSILKSAYIIFKPVLLGRWSLIYWMRTILEKLALRPEFVVYLYLTLLSEMPEENLFESFDNVLRLAHVTGALFTYAKSEPATSNILIDFCWRHKAVSFSGLSLAINL